MPDNDFYIGWMPNAPGSIAGHIKKVIIALVIVVITVGILAALSQKKFGTGQFEFGRLTQITGVYHKTPVPCIRLPHITIPLIGYGKFGADGVMQDLENEQHIDLNQKEITLKGTLLYNDGKLLMQVNAADTPLVAVNRGAGHTVLPVQKDLGEQTIRGEIVDPKCFFGVMKPGEGKPHKDCAIRCILGGIPPVLKVQSPTGEANYYFIVGPHGEKMNQAVKDFVAAPVSIKANVVQYDDWIVLYTNPPQSITRIAGWNLVNPGAQAITCMVEKH